ncbi:MAG: hypothetical protein WCT49_01190 [Candidatus Paceibacterota bacterium]|jgi:hypothetical protein|nr:hypothetical protein [Candidatus Paceibacterota bacterium]
MKKNIAVFLLFFSLLPALAFADVCPELSTAQKAVGVITRMFTLTNVMLTVAIIVGACCFLFLFRYYVAKLIRCLADVPKELWEGILYLFGVVLIVNGLYYDGANSIWLAFFGCLVFSGALGLTGVLHERDNPKIFFGILTLVWGAVAVWYQSELIGFFSVGALMGLVGFVGLEDTKAVTKGTLTAFFILALYISVKLSGFMPEHVGIFESGAKWFGAFAFYLGLLIMSSKWSSHEFSYGRMQILTIAAGIAGIAIGTLADLPVISGVAGTFSAFYLLEKLLEIEFRDKVAYAWAILFLSVVVTAIGFWANSHMDIISPYLLF